MAVQLCVPVDVEAALAEAFAGLSDMHVAAPPVPAQLSPDPIWVVATRTGGGRTGRVVDNHYVDFDVYAPRDMWGESMAAAGLLLARVEELPMHGGPGAVWCAATVETMPYENPDPDHPTLARSTFSMLVTTRARIVEE